MCLTELSHTSGCLRDGDDAAHLQYFDDRVQIPVERVRRFLDYHEFVVWHVIAWARLELAAVTKHRSWRDFSYEEAGCLWSWEHRHLYLQKHRACRVRELIVSRPLE